MKAHFIISKNSKIIRSFSSVTNFYDYVFERLSPDKVNVKSYNVTIIDFEGDTLIHKSLIEFMLISHQVLEEHIANL